MASGLATSAASAPAMVMHAAAPTGRAADAIARLHRAHRGHLIVTRRPRGRMQARYGRAARDVKRVELRFTPHPRSIVSVLVLVTSRYMEHQLAALRLLAPRERFDTDPDAARADEVEAIVAFRFATGIAPRFPNLRLVAGPGAGTDELLSAGDIPAHVPIVRAVDPLQGSRMAQYVGLMVLRQLRDLPRLEAPRRRAGRLRAAAAWLPRHRLDPHAPSGGGDRDLGRHRDASLLPRPLQRSGVHAAAHAGDAWPARCGSISRAAARRVPGQRLARRRAARSRSRRGARRRPPLRRGARCLRHRAVVAGQSTLAPARDPLHAARRGDAAIRRSGTANSR